MAQLPTPREPFLVYLEANPLVFWLTTQSNNPDPGAVARHHRLNQEAELLINVFSNHTRARDPIVVITSQWALIEAHSTLYKEALWANRVAWNLSDPRKHFPPHTPSLNQATNRLESRMQVLSSSINLRIVEPTLEVWNTALQIGEECGIYAPDSLHLATALQLGCNLFITDDINLLNCIHHFLQNGVLDQIWRRLYFSPPALAFYAAPLDLTQRVAPGILTAGQYLAQMGYT